MEFTLTITALNVRSDLSVSGPSPIAPCRVQGFRKLVPPPGPYVAPPSPTFNYARDILRVFLGDLFHQIKKPLTISKTMERLASENVIWLDIPKTVPSCIRRIRIIARSDKGRSPERVTRKARPETRSTMTIFRGRSTPVVSGGH